jgi:hypothetical protein
MLFNVSIAPLPSGQPNFNVQVEATDLIAALEGAKAPILKSALQSAEILTAALPTPKPGQAPESPPAA